MITAWNGDGYYHADEHYQVIEFSRVKSGENRPQDMPWEFAARIRSSIQPLICYGLFGTLRAVHVSDPYTQTFILRLFTTCFALFVLTRFLHVTSPMQEPKHRKLYACAVYLLWFLPYINVRFTSETLSGLFFLWGLTLYLSPKRAVFTFYGIGLLLGFAFLFRFQTAIMFTGFIAWLFIVKKESGGAFIKIIVAYLLVCVIGMLGDSWFYGEFATAPWNYFKDNILKEKASDFGTSSGEQYVRWIFQFPGYPIGILLMTAFAVLLFRQPRNIFLWIVIPFVLVHSFIPHKEERFLFPVANFSAAILFMGYEQCMKIKWIPYFLKTKVIGYTILAVVLLVNIVGLLAVSVKSAGQGRMRITRYIHEEYKGKQVRLLYLPWSNPYDPWGGLPARFYLDPNVEMIGINSLCSLQSISPDTNKINLLVLRNGDLRGKECVDALQRLHYTQQVQSLPPWVEKLNVHYKGFKDEYVTRLFLQETHPGR